MKRNNEHFHGRQKCDQSKKNEEAFNAAVEEIAHASRHLLDAVGGSVNAAELAA